ncbi:unnamed protein product [Sphacelaria rigidula]
MCGKGKIRDSRVLFHSSALMPVCSRKSSDRKVAMFSFILFCFRCFLFLRLPCLAGIFCLLPCIYGPYSLSHVLACLLACLLLCCTSCSVRLVRVPRCCWVCPGKEK